MPGGASTRLGGGCRWRDLSPRQRTTAALVAVVVALPFLVAALQALADGWFPIGDDGTMLTVARQVFTAHPPLTGETGSFDKYGVQAFHPGPLVYYVLAPFVAVLGGAAGLLLGAAFVSMVAIVTTGYVALRAWGPGAALWAWTTALLMVWSLGGTAYLYRPFKAVSALLVILCFLHVSAALAAGRSTLLPIWVLAASYPAAASVRYAAPVAVVAAATVACVLVARWHRSAPGRAGETAAATDGGIGHRLRRMAALDHDERRSLLIAALLAALCWWAPAYEALSNRGGNLRQLYRGGRAATGATDGVATALGEFARAVVFHPMMTVADHAASTAPYVGAAVIIGVGAVILVVVRRRRLARRHWAAVVVAATAVAAILASLAAAPADEGFGAYQILGAAPVGAFAIFTSGLLLGVAVGDRRRVSAPLVLRLGTATVILLVVVVAVPGPIDDSREDYPWGFAATRELIDEAAPHLQSDSYWNFWLVGGRTTPAVFVGLKAGLEAEGVATGLNARAPGLGDPTGPDPRTPSGNVLVMPSMLPDPGDDWTAIATYDPPGRSDTEAARTAEALVDFARDTHPEPSDALAQGLPRILCPGLADEPSGYTLEACPAAQEVLAADNPIAELPPAVVALVYLVQFGDITSLPLFDGAEPPSELLEAARESWDDVPLTVYVNPADT